MIINPYVISDNFKNKSIKATKEIENQETPSLDKIYKKTEEYIISNYLDKFIKLDSNNIKEKILEYIYANFKKVEKQEIERIVCKVSDKIFGYGILQKYIEDKNTTDIRVVRYDDVYVKQLGKWKNVEESFSSEKQLEEYVRYCVMKNDATINNEYPVVALSDKKFNLRLEAGIKPANIESPSLVIRIHNQEDDKRLETLMLKDDMFDLETYRFLLKAIQDEKNIIICGRGGSGKTTLLRAIIDKIPRERSIVSNEETAELYLKNRNMIQREVVSNRIESKKIDLEKLTKHALIMSSETIVLGELKSSEASVFFDAISTGHNGYATVHADSTINTIDRIIVLIKKDIRAQSYKEEFLRQLLATSIDYIIYMERYKVSTISEVFYNKQKREIECKDIISSEK